MTSDNNWPPSSLRKVGEIELTDHCRLTEDCSCYYLGEYTARYGWKYSKTNSVIWNLKKPLSKQGHPEWKHKIEAIQEIATLIRKSLVEEAIPTLTFVPAPPSKSPDDPEYDDRMFQICSSISENVDSRPILQTAQSRQPAHQGSRPDSNALLENLIVDDEVLAGRAVGDHIILLDDVLVTGATFIACRDRLREVLPDTPVTGVFVARRVFPRGLPDDASGVKGI